MLQCTFSTYYVDTPNNKLSQNTKSCFISVSLCVFGANLIKNTCHMRVNRVIRNNN